MNDRDLLLCRIANHLIINASFLDNYGLFYGKMGISLFFAHYSRRTKKEIFEDYMELLLKDIYIGVNEGFSIDLQEGLCGIGWGIVYLLKNGFLEGEPSAIFRAIDSRLLSLNLSDEECKRRDISFYISERISLGDYDKRLLRFNLFPMLKSDDIGMFIVSDINLGDNTMDWKLGLHDGCSGVGIKMMLK